jgi:hypothetical protein
VLIHPRPWDRWHLRQIDNLRSVAHNVTANPVRLSSGDMARTTLSEPGLGLYLRVIGPSPLRRRRELADGLPGTTPSECATRRESAPRQGRLMVPKGS